MQIEEVRVRILEQMIPKASQFGISNPQTIIEACSQFEKYVIGSDEDEDSLTSQTRRKRSPRKGKAESVETDDQTPAHVGQVD